MTKKELFFEKMKNREFFIDEKEPQTLYFELIPAMETVEKLINLLENHSWVHSFFELYPDYRNIFSLEVFKERIEICIPEYYSTDYLIDTELDNYGDKILALTHVRHSFQKIKEKFAISESSYVFDSL